MLSSLFQLVCLVCQATSPSSSPPTPLSLSLPSALVAPTPHARPALVGPPPVPVRTPAPALGDVWTLDRGRRLMLNLTPTPERCAPLLEMTF